MGKTSHIREKVRKRLIQEGCVGIAWSLESCAQFDEPEFLSFKYGYLLADNEDALAEGLPHRHNLIDLYRSLEGVLDNDFVDIGKNAFHVYGTVTDRYWAPHCSFCRSYVSIEQYLNMYYNG